MQTGSSLVFFDALKNELATLKNENMFLKAQNIDIKQTLADLVTSRTELVSQVNFLMEAFSKIHNEQSFFRNFCSTAERDIKMLKNEYFDIKSKHSILDLRVKKGLPSNEMENLNSKNSKDFDTHSVQGSQTARENTTQALEETFNRERGNGSTLEKLESLKKKMELVFQETKEKKRKKALATERSLLNNTNDGALSSSRFSSVNISKLPLHEVFSQQEGLLGLNSKDMIVDQSHVVKHLTYETPLKFGGTQQPEYQNPIISAKESTVFLTGGEQPSLKSIDTPKQGKSETQDWTTISSLKDSTNSFITPQNTNANLGAAFASFGGSYQQPVTQTSGFLPYSSSVTPNNFMHHHHHSNSAQNYTHTENEWDKSNGKQLLYHSSHNVGQFLDYTPALSSLPRHDPSVSIKGSQSFREGRDPTTISHKSNSEKLYETPLKQQDYYEKAHFTASKPSGFSVEVNSEVLKGSLDQSIGILQATQDTTRSMNYLENLTGETDLLKKSMISDTSMLQDGMSMENLATRGTKKLILSKRGGNKSKGSVDLKKALGRPENEL